MTQPSPYKNLEPGSICQTVEVLLARIGERFPGSGLGKVCQGLLEIGQQAQARSERIARPIYPLRVAAGGLIALMILLTLGSYLVLPMPAEDETIDFLDFVQVLEPGVNVLVLVGVAIFFLVTLEKRIKRGRALRAVHELRSVAHIIDMHQLTKDPDRVLRKGEDTAASPARKLSPFELTRYLDYCSEMLSLTGKVAAVYVRNFDDDAAIASVSQVENLTTGLSRKIWQKLMILNATPDAEQGGTRG